MSLYRVSSGKYKRVIDETCDPLIVVPKDNVIVLKADNDYKQSYLQMTYEQAHDLVKALNQVLADKKQKEKDDYDAGLLER